MNANEPPEGTSGGAPPAPVAVQQTTVIQVGTRKSVVGAVLLAFFFGPLGMLYATVPGAIVMFFVNIIVAIPTLGLGLFVTFPIGVIWAGLAADSQNKRIQGISAQQVTTAPAAEPLTPAAPRPPAPALSPQSPAPPREEPEPPTESIESGDGQVDVVLRSAAPEKATCQSCGQEINPQARFCSACGTARATA
jgi:hypothetical protein